MSCCLDNNMKLNTKEVNRQPQQQRYCSYESKRALTEIEQGFFVKLYDLYKDRFYVQFQVPLSSVVNKVSTDKYQNELYRTVDFALFDKNTFRPLILIELNDHTHMEGRRQYRDMRVKEICIEAKIKLITFWTSYENKKDYIFKRINDELNNY